MKHIHTTGTNLMEEWEANPFSTLGFIVRVVVKIELLINVLGTTKGRC